MKIDRAHVREVLARIKAGDKAHREIGTTLRELREAKGLTLRAVAKHLGLSAPFISDVEHGRRQLSPPDLVIAAELLGTRPEDLFALLRCTKCGQRLVSAECDQTTRTEGE